MWFKYLLALTFAFSIGICSILAQIPQDVTILHPAEACEIQLTAPKISTDKLSLKINNRLEVPFFLDPKLDIRFSMIVRVSDPNGKEVSKSAPKEFGQTLKGFPKNLNAFIEVSEYVSLDVDTKFYEFLKKNRALFSRDNNITEVLLRVDISGILFPNEYSS